jgi:hypothetical protein
MSIMKCNLLGCGLVAGPLFIAASLTQAFTRKGFDLARHPISLLSLGAPGWVQIANFVVCGTLYLLGAAGMRQALGQSRGGTWGPLLIGVTGVGLIIAGVFTADPGAGFPPGAPAGAPTMSWHGLLHELGFLLTFVAAISASVVLAWRYAAQRRRGWMVAALMTPCGSARGRRLARPQHAQRPPGDHHCHPVRVLTAVFAEVLTQGPIDQVEEDDHLRSRDQPPARH